jgi:hypothetical protein
MNLLLIDNRVNDIDTVLNSLLSNIDYVLIDFQNDTLETICEKIKNKNQTYEHVGIFQENYETATYKYVYSFEASSLASVGSVDPSLNTWTSYIQMITYFKNELNMTTLDLMGCNIMSNADWDYVIQSISGDLNIEINSSKDTTGSAELGGNWILESSNENLIGIYFDENIKNYKFVLGVLNNSVNPGVLPYIQYKLDRYNELSQVALVSGANGVMSQTGVADASYNGNVSCLDLSNNPIYANDGSCYFNGSSRYVTLPSVTLNSTNGYTFSFWTNIPVSPQIQYSRFIGLNPNTSNYIGFEISNTTSPFSFTCGIDSTSFLVYNSVFYTNIWYNVVVSMSYSATNNSTWKFYVNGNLLKTTTGNRYPSSIVYTNNAIGLYLNAYMYDVRVYNSELSNTQIFNLYKNPLDFFPIICYPLNNASDGLVNRGSLYATTSGLPFNCDLSGSSLSNLPTFTADSPDRQLSSNRSMLLNATYSQFAYFPALSSNGGGFATLNNGLTFSTWFRLTNNSGTYKRIFDFGNGAGSNNILITFPFTNSTNIFISLRKGGATNLTEFTIPNTSNLSLNTWYHIAWTMKYSAGTDCSYNIYLNGNKVFSNPNIIQSYYYPTAITRTNNFLGKSNWTADGYPNIALNDFRVYQNVLSEGQVKKIYSEILKSDWIQYASTSNKYTQYYLRGFLDISGDFTMRNGRPYFPANSISTSYLSTNVQCKPFNNVLTGLSTCSGGLRVTNGLTAPSFYAVNSNINYNNITGILQVSSANTTSNSVTTSYLNSTSNGYIDGLVFTIYSGYMDENTDNFVTNLARKALPNTGIVNSIPSISEGTDYIIPENDTFEYYSVMWVGYFKADVTGVWTFYTLSDDGSYLWVGSSAESGYTRANSVVNNGGVHATQERSGTVSLVAGTYYYIRIIFGEASGQDNMQVSFSKPGSTTKITNGLGYFYNTEAMRYLAFSTLGSPNITATNSTIRSLNTTAVTTTNLYATSGYFRGGVTTKQFEIKTTSVITTTGIGTNVLPNAVNIVNSTGVGYKLLYQQDPNSSSNTAYGANIATSNNGPYNCVWIGCNGAGDLPSIIYQVIIGYNSYRQVWTYGLTILGSNSLVNHDNSYFSGNLNNRYITCLGNNCGNNDRSNGYYNSYFGSNTDSSMNTSMNYNNSTTIGAYSQFFDRNQIVFGTTSERLYVPGSYVGISKYVPSNPYAIDISGNMALSGSLTTANGTTNITLNINNISSYYSYNTIDNSVNGVRIYVNNLNSNTGIGSNVFNALTTGVNHTVFGNHRIASSGITSSSNNSWFGYNNIPPGGGNTNNTFGINVNTSNSNRSGFGAYSSYSSGFGLDIHLFGAYSLYKQTSSNGGNITCVGFQSGYNSNNSGFNTFLGYNSGYYDICGNYNTYVGANTGKNSTNTLTLQYSTAIGANAVVDVSNQITFGTTSERLYVPGSYLGIGQFSPGQGRALDVSGNAQISSYLTTSTLITTFSTSAALNSTYNSANGVRIFSNGTNTGIGYNAFNALISDGVENVSFGNHAWGANITNGDRGTAFGYSTLAPRLGGYTEMFGAFVSLTPYNSCMFGAYCNANTTSSGGGDSAAFGAFALYNKNGTTSHFAIIGYKAGYNSRSTYATYAGYQAGQYDVTGFNNTCIGSDSGQVSTNTLALRYSTAIGANAVVDVSNQITFGTTSERLYVPGSYVGIQTFNPSTLRALDVSGNAKFSNALTVRSLINTFPTNATLNSTYNTINSVRLYSNNSSTTTGIGYNVLNALTTGNTNAVFGFAADSFTTETNNSVFGCLNPNQTSGSKCIFGNNISNSKIWSTYFGVYINNGNNNSNTMFGAYSFYNQYGAYGGVTGFGYQSSYDSRNGINNSSFGYKAGYRDIWWGSGTSVGANADGNGYAGQISGSTYIGANATGSGSGGIANQIGFGTTNERLYVPGSYLGIGQFSPGQGRALDVSGNAQFSSYLTTGTLITTFSTSAALNTTYITVNGVRIYNNTSSGNTGIGFSMYDALTTGAGSNTIFGNNRASYIIITGNGNHIFGFNTTSLSNPTTGGTYRAIFGAFNGIASSNQSTFGSYSNTEASSADSTIFGSFCSYNKTGTSNGSQAIIGYAAGYNSNTAFKNTHAGYQSGQYDVNGSNNTYMGANSGQISTNTLTLINSTAIGASARIDVSNQIVFGTTSERLYVPGSYLGIGQFTPGQGRALDVSGNAQISSYLTTGTLITTFSTSATVNTTYNSANGVRIFNNGTNTGIGYNTFNALTSGTETVTFGNNLPAANNTIQQRMTVFGYTNTGSAAGYTAYFGALSNFMSGNSVYFGSNLKGAAAGSVVFGAFALYTQIGYSLFTAFGYRAGYGSNRALDGYSTYVGYQAGQHDITGFNNTCIGSDSGQVSTNTSVLRYSTAIGANAVIDVSNQITFGTTNERLYVPGSYLGIGQFSPGQGRALDISGNAQFSSYLTTGTLITTFSTSATVNTTYNSANGVRIYYNNGLQSTSIGYNAFNLITDGSFNVSFGNHAWAANITTGDHGTMFGYATSSGFLSGFNEAFGAFTPSISSNSPVFGAYCNPTGGGGGQVAVFGAFVTYNRTGSSNNYAIIGYKAGYNSRSTNTTYVGYQAGQYDVTGVNNTCIGSDSGQISTNTLVLRYSTAIGANAVIDVSNQITFGTTNERLYVPGSYVGIRKFLPGQGYSFDVSGNMRISIGTLRVSGTGTAQSWPTWSDYRIKTNIEPLSEKYTINNLNPVHYTNLLSNKQDIGFIAHEVQNTYPELVIGAKDDTEYQSLNYNGLIPILTKEVKDIKQKIKEKTIHKYEIVKPIALQPITEPTSKYTNVIGSLNLSPGTWVICYQVCLTLKNAFHTKNIRVGLSNHNNKQLHNIQNYEIIGNFLYSNMEIESFEKNTSIDLILEYEGTKDSIELFENKNYFIYKKLSKLVQ